MKKLYLLLISAFFLIIASKAQDLTIKSLENGDTVYQGQFNIITGIGNSHLSFFRRFYPICFAFPHLLIISGTGTTCWDDFHVQQGNTYQNIIKNQLFQNFYFQDFVPLPDIVYHF
jgi:hypothetical protein